MYIKTLTVSELNGYIKKTIDNDFILSNIRVKGEISNLKYHSSGHIYFSLKDEGSKINCIMFKNNAINLNVKLIDGRKVEAVGKISIYIKDGSYQLYCKEVNDIGLGELYLKFNQLKEKLSREGLFAEENKKKLPAYPFNIGVITSPTGAAIKDIVQVAKRRNPNIKLTIYPALVQGEESVRSIISGIAELDSRGDIDSIIIARGGGSIEELWSFNSEDLAYAIYKCKTPVISGVGHETDYTICDFVADRRAATPSQAAEIAVIPYEELLSEICYFKELLNRKAEDNLSQKFANLELWQKTLENYNPMNSIVHRYDEIDNLYNRLKSNVFQGLDKKRGELASLRQLLDAHNPLNVLNKGYSVTYQDNEIVKCAKDFKDDENAKIKIRFYDGVISGIFKVNKKEIV